VREDIGFWNDMSLYNNFPGTYVISGVAVTQQYPGVKYEAQKYGNKDYFCRGWQQIPLLHERTVILWVESTRDCVMKTVAVGLLPGTASNDRQIACLFCRFTNAC